MNSEPIVSVVIPAYNNERFIGATMKSVLSQGPGDMEVLVADHSSTDRTWELLEGIADPRVRIFRTPAGGGAERNWNRVSREAKGRYVKLLCGDDLLLPGVIDRQVALLENNPGAVLTTCPRKVVDSAGRTVIPRRGMNRVRGRLSGTAAIRAVVRAGSNIYGEPGSALFRRDVLEAIGYWDFTFPFLVDEVTYVRALLQGDLVPDREVGAAFRMNAGQTSVALVETQAAEVSSFHRWIREEHPEIVSDADVALGDKRAHTTARRRQLAYRLFKSRMG